MTRKKLWDHDQVQSCLSDPFRVVAVHIIAEYEVHLVAEDGRTLQIYLDTGHCDESYFDAESIEVLKGLVGHVLLDLEESEAMGFEERDCRQSDQKIHALLVRTDRLSESLLWRNDSSGYYDGTLYLYALDRAPGPTG